MWEEMTNSMGGATSPFPKHTTLVYAPLAAVAARLVVCEAVQERGSLAAQQQVLLWQMAQAALKKKQKFYSQQS